MTHVRAVDADNHYHERLDAFTRQSLKPMDFLDELSEFSEPEVKRIMRDNGLELLGPSR